MKQRTLVTCAAGLCLAAAICIALYPAVSSFVNEKYRSEIRTAYSEELSGKDANALQEIRAPMLCRKSGRRHRLTINRCCQGFPPTAKRQSRQRQKVMSTN